MWIIDTLSRILHVGTAITLVGGSAFILFVVVPAANRLADDVRDGLVSDVWQRWKRFVHPGILIFLLTGFYNYLRAIEKHEGDSLYHALVGTKILIGLVVFFIAAALVGKSQALESIRQNRTKWLRIMILLAIVIVAISGFVKVRGVPDQAPQATAGATPASVDQP